MKGAERFRCGRPTGFCFMKIDGFSYKRARMFPKDAVVPPEVISFLEGNIAHIGTLKERVKRSVFKIYAEKNDAEPVYFLKYDHPPLLKDIGKGLIRPKVKWEYRITRRLFELGVPVIEPVFCAWTRKDGIFVSKAIPGARTFETEWEKIKQSPDSRRGFIAELRRLLDLILKNNIYHPDLHGGNVLTIRQGDAFRFFLVDVFGVRIRKRLSERQTLQNLRIIADMRNDLEEDEIAFLISGLPGVFHAAGYVEVWSRIIDHYVEVFYQKGFRHGRERIYKKKKYIHIIKDATGTFRIRKNTLTPSVAKAVIARHKAVREANPKRLLKNSAHRCVSRVHVNDSDYVVKEYRRKKPFRRYGEAQTSWYNTWGLHLALLPAAEPLALFYEKKGSGFIIFENIAGESLADRMSKTFAQQKNLEPLFEQYFNFIVNLCCWKIYCKNLKPADFIINGNDRLFLIADNGLVFDRQMTPKDWERQKKKMLQGEPRNPMAAFGQWLKNHPLHFPCRSTPDTRLR